MSKVNQFSVVNPYAAGIDVGSRSHWVSVGEGADNIRHFGVFTSDIDEMIAYLEQHQVKTIAMESTGFYWKPLFVMLQAHGFEVFLVNAGHVKNVRGKKTDVSDCQWIWQLHSCGLLHNSFQPDSFTEQLRAYARQRRSLVEGASRQVAKMQKALVLMNIHLSVVLSDISGQSGQAIIKAILKGERNGAKLAALADPRVRADRKTIAKALTGHWQEPYLFELRQAWDMYQFLQAQIAECSAAMEELLQQQVAHCGQADLVYEPQKKCSSPKNGGFDVGRYAYQLSGGVDLMAIGGINFNTILTLLAETGVQLSAFPTAAHFVSWMCLNPNNKVSGGKVLSTRSRKNKSPLAFAFRQAANTISNQKNSALADFFHRLAYRKGRKVAIMATARKLAVIVYNMLRNKESYSHKSLEQYQKNLRTQKIKSIQRTLRRLDIKPTELAVN